MNRLPDNFLLVLLIYLPFQSFLINLLQKQTVWSESAVFWITHWYEPVVIGAFFVIFKRNLFRKGPVLPLIVAACALIILGIISVLFLSADAGRALEGYRLNLMAVIILILAWRDNAAGTIDRFKKIYLIVAVLVAFWALVERFLPANYWAEWGLIPAGKGFGWGGFAVNPILQSASIIGTPNQLGAYLLPAFFLLWFAYRRHKNRRYLFGLLLIGTAVIFTFSRSTFIGLIGGAFLALFLVPTQVWIRAAAGGVLILAVGAVELLNQNIGLWRDLVTHGASQSEHYSAIINSWAEIVRRVDEPTQFLLGSGLGTAGPLAVKYGSGLISESWYFQLWLELGLIGLLLWLLLIYFVLRQLYRRGEVGLFAGIVAVSIAAALLHTWADNPALAITLFVLAGSSLADRRVSKIAD
ncbi:MAG: hypothetical protein AAB360_00010 [Patescibacteria group bacterium]